MPTPGDVDVVMASELMEAGRSVLRGLVTPEQTTLIASTHRAFAVAEKETPGDGVGDPAVVSIATEFAARRLIAFDMEAIAKAEGSVISAAMFGALAATKALPFDRAAFESAIRAGGTGVTSSLRAFAAAFNRTRERPIEPVRRFPEKRFAAMPDAAGHPELDRLVARIRSTFPGSAQPMLFAGVRRLVDYLDPDYALEYLDRLGTLFDIDRAHGGEKRGFAFTAAAAKYVAVAMAYDDVARVADLKIRESRRARVRVEVAAAEDTIVATTEYFHPRADELCGALPRRWGEWIEGRPAVFKASGSRGQPRTAHPHQHRDRLSRACGGGKLEEPTARIATPRARSGAPRGLADPRRASAGDRLRAGRGGAGVPSFGQGLFRHPCARILEVRPRDVGGADARQTR